MLDETLINVSKCFGKMTFQLQNLDLSDDDDNVFIKFFL